MTSQGSAHARFQRAIKRGHLLHAEIAARELASLSPADSLALVLLYQRLRDEKFERATRRWLRRLQIQHSLRHRELELVRAALGALGTRFEDVDLTVLLETCRELRLPAPTLPQ
jgi:tRNA(Arg) A34 adenosine deaminase TadA